MLLLLLYSLGGYHVFIFHIGFIFSDDEENSKFIFDRCPVETELIDRAIELRLPS